MSSVPELDRDLRALYAVDIDEARYRSAMERALRVVDDEIAATRAIERRPSWRAGVPRLTPRALIVMILVLMLLAAVAVAQPAVRRVLFGDADKPANRVTDFQQPATRSFELAGMEDEPSEDPLERGLAIGLAASAEMRTDDPRGWGTPNMFYARVLLDRDVAGDRIRIAAAPTSRGYLCYATVIGPVTGGTCVDRLDSSHPARFGVTAIHGETTIAGIVIDGVRSVSVEFAGGHAEPAKVEGNGIAWVGESPGPERVVVTLADGSVVRYSSSGARI
jgi:hypothetical protein